MSRFEHFTLEEKRMLAESIWRKQRSFISGDKQFKEYGVLLDEVLSGLDNYIPGRIV